jgi:hypothetical protein
MFQSFLIYSIIDSCLEGLVSQVESSFRVVDFDFRVGREFSLLVVTPTEFSYGMFRNGKVTLIDEKVPLYPINIIGSHGEFWRFHPSEVKQVVWK